MQLQNEKYYIFNGFIITDFAFELSVIKESHDIAIYVTIFQIDATMILFVTYRSSDLNRIHKN